MWATSARPSGRERAEGARHGGNVIVEVAAGQQAGRQGGLQDPAAGQRPQRQADDQAGAQGRESDDQGEGDAAPEARRVAPVLPVPGLLRGGDTGAEPGDRMGHPAVEPMGLAEERVQKQRHQRRQADRGGGRQARDPQRQHGRSMVRNSIAVNGLAWSSRPAGGRRAGRGTPVSGVRGG